MRSSGYSGEVWSMKAFYPTNGATQSTEGKAGKYEGFPQDYPISFQIS